MPCAVALAIGATQRTETSDAISLDMLHLPGLEGDELLASSRRLRVDLHTPGRGRVWGGLLRRLPPRCGTKRRAEDSNLYGLAPSGFQGREHAATSNHQESPAASTPRHS